VGGREGGRRRTELGSAGLACEDEQAQKKHADTFKERRFSLIYISVIQNRRAADPHHPRPQHALLRHAPRYAQAHPPSLPSSLSSFLPPSPPSFLPSSMLIRIFFSPCLACLLPFLPPLLRCFFPQDISPATTLSHGPSQPVRPSLPHSLPSSLPPSFLPAGHIAGHYTKEDCHIDLTRLAHFAGARLIHTEVGREGREGGREGGLLRYVASTLLSMCQRADKIITVLHPSLIPSLPPSIPFRPAVSIRCSERSAVKTVVPPYRMTCFRWILALRPAQVWWEDKRSVGREGGSRRKLTQDSYPLLPSFPPSLS